MNLRMLWANLQKLKINIRLCTSTTHTALKQVGLLKWHLYIKNNLCTSLLCFMNKRPLIKRLTFQIHIKGGIEAM